MIKKLGFEFEGVRRVSQAAPEGRVIDGYHHALFGPERLPPLDVSWAMRASLG